MSHVVDIVNNLPAIVLLAAQSAAERTQFRSLGRHNIFVGQERAQRSAFGHRLGVEKRSVVCAGLQCVVPSPGDVKSKVDNLIAKEVQSGKLTSSQATELQNVFANTFSQAGGPDGAGGASGGTGDTGNSDSTQSSSTGSDSNRLLSELLKLLQSSQSQTASYGSNGQTTQTSTALVLNHQS